MQRLIEGFHRFRQGYHAERRDLYERLAAEGQRPRAMVIACADSRVDPATIFAAAPGELFVVRNVAALVPPSQPDAGYHGTSAALEFAVDVLGVRQIVVMGHGLCGGVAASLAAEEKPPGRFIGPWIELLAPVRDAVLRERGRDVLEDRQRLLEQAGILLSLQNLRSFSFIADALSAGTLTLHGAWFSIAGAELHAYDMETGVFVPVTV